MGVAARQRHVSRPVWLDAGESVWPSGLVPGAGARPWTAHRARRRTGARPCGVCPGARARRLRVRRAGRRVACARRVARPVGDVSGRTCHAWMSRGSVPGMPARQGLHVCPCRRAAGRGWSWAPCLPRAGTGWVGTPARRPASSGLHRTCAQAVPPPWPLDAPSAWGVPCRTDAGQEGARAPWSWWGARTSPHRGVVSLPGRAAHGGHDTGGRAPPGPPAWVWGTQRPAPTPVRRPRSGRQMGSHPEGVVSCPCGP